MASISPCPDSRGRGQREGKPCDLLCPKEQGRGGEEPGLRGVLEASWAGAQARASEIITRTCLLRADPFRSGNTAEELTNAIPNRALDLIL